jgi:anti-anti-sigma factor
MEITQQLNGDVLDMRASGRIDGYWADHLERALADVVSAGHHRVRLDCGEVNFMSSAGIAVLMKFRKELARIDGTFHVVNPSKPVATTLALARLSDLLLEGAQKPAAAGAPAKAEPAVRKEVFEDAALEIYELDARAALACRAVGDVGQLATGAFTDAHVLSSADAAPPVFAVGIGAFGDSFDDCRPRFGELLSIAGATVYQPADGTNVPDYLLAGGQLGSEVRLLYGLTGTGRFSHIVRFEAPAQGTPVGLSTLLRACLGISGAPAIGVVILAETVGLVGAALRRSPAAPPADGDFFAHPGIRTRLAFTAEPTFTRGVTLAGGVAAARPGGTSAGPPAEARSAEQGELRPLGEGCSGHLHAAAFPFRAIKKGRIDLGETVTALFDADAPLGVLHLLHDDRAAAGAGESEFVRGACWIAPLTAGGGI